MLNIAIVKKFVILRLFAINITGKFIINPNCAINSHIPLKSVNNGLKKK